VVDDQVFEGHFLTFSDKAVQHHAHSQEDALQDVGVHLLLLGLGIGNGNETGNVFADKFALKNSGYFSDPFYLSDLVFVYLGLDCFEELFLLSTFVFCLLFDEFSKFSAVFGIG
jgi:hypothetical protein